MEQALVEENYTIPTPIQAQAIPPIMEGKDMLGCAQTGTGKTAAFALPILHRLLNAPADKSHRGPTLPRVLVLAPTRELTTQIGESFATYGRHTGLTHTCIFGGVSQFHQVRALHRGVDVIVATPGRLIDLMEQRLVNLSAVSVFVLDESDRMLDMGFINPIRRISAALPAKRQTLLFSATMPREILHLAESLLHHPVKVSVTPVASTVELTDQSVYFVGRERKQALLEFLMHKGHIRRALVFTRTKHGADKLCKKLNHARITAEAIHGNKAQNQRTRALAAFSTGKSRVLVATDVAARGLDVDGITHVFNFDIPHEPESYVHRIGRTGRAGASGFAVSFCAAEERDWLKGIERLTGKRIPSNPLPEELPAPTKPEYAPAHEPHPHPRAHGTRDQHSHHAPRAPRAQRSSHAPRNDSRSSHAPAHGSGHAPKSGHHSPPGGRSVRGNNSARSRRSR